MLLLINIKVHLLKTHVYLTHRSTDTAITLIINDILISLDNKATCYLMLLDLSSAFDTLYHNILSIILNAIAIPSSPQFVYVFCFI